jgi:zinc protease
MYSASGKITDAAGGGVQSVKMVFTRVSGSGNLPNYVITDVKGEWWQAGFETGSTYRVTPTNQPGQSYTFTPEYRDFSSTGDSITGLDFQVLETYSISGYIRTASGAGIPGVSVLGVTTDSSGYYIKDELTPGNYTVQPSKAGFTFEPTSQVVTVPPNTTDVDFVGTGMAGIHEPYVICVSQSTYQDSSWQTVVDALKSKHDASIVTYSGTSFPGSVRTELSNIMPGYVCFVAKLSELCQYGESYVRQTHQITRALDADPYGDCIWGIVTGCDANDAMRMVQTPPLLVTKGLLKTAGDWLEYLPEGTYHSEGNSTTMWVKPHCGPIDKTQAGPADDTKPLVDELNSNTVDIMVTSGHATSCEWQLHYPDPDGEGFFRTDNCKLYGIDAGSSRYNINSTNPKIYYAPGNCLIGLVNCPDCNDSMVAGWLHTGGAVQYCGYVVSTWFGYMGWGVSDYFFKLVDRFTFAEAFFLTNQALMFDIENNTPGIDRNGLMYDRDVLVLYGDPAYNASIERCPGIEPIYDQELDYTEISQGYYRFTMSVQLNSAVNVSKPVIAFLPFRVTDVSVLNNNARAIEITDDMAMMQIWAEGDPDIQPGQEWQLVFMAKQITSPIRWRFAGDINRDGVVNFEDFAIMAANWLEGTTP